MLKIFKTLTLALIVASFGTTNSASSASLANDGVYFALEDVETMSKVMPLELMGSVYTQFSVNPSALDLIRDLAAYDVDHNHISVNLDIFRDQTHKDIIEFMTAVTVDSIMAFFVSTTTQSIEFLDILGGLLAKYQLSIGFEPDSNDAQSEDLIATQDAFLTRSMAGGLCLIWLSMGLMDNCAQMP